jgi:hypothetical protein
MIYSQIVQLVIFLSTFNTPCMCLKIQCDGESVKVEFGRHLNTAQKHLNCINSMRACSACEASQTEMQLVH